MGNSLENCLFWPNSGDRTDMNYQRLSHAYMITGTDADRRKDTAIRLAASLLCTGENAPCSRCRDCRKVFSGIHPDVIFVERQPDTKGQLHRELLVDQIRSMTSDAVIAPNEASRKVYILPEADRMNLPAQNALLKALEDPPGHACFLLCAAAADSLLPTVRSRCVRLDDTERTVSLPPLSPLTEAYLQAAASADPAEMTLYCMLRTKLTREETEVFLSETADALADILCLRRPNPGLDREHIFHISALMDRAQDYLRHNLSPKQIFGVLAAETLR